MIYSPITKKLGVVIKDENGKYLSGYVLKDISKPNGEIDLSKSYRKSGEENLIESSSLNIMKMGEKSATVDFAGTEVKLAPMELSRPPFGECYFVCAGPLQDWYMCFACCVLSDAC